MSGHRKNPMGGGLRYRLTALITAAAMLTAGLGTGIALANGSDDSDTTTRQTTGSGNSWQIVKCGPENKDSEDCTRVSKDGNVRVHKWVTPTSTENVFDVHLSVDKRDDEVSEVLNATALFGNANNIIDLGGTKECVGQCPILSTGNKEFYYQIVFI